MDFPGHFENIFQQLNHQRVSGQLCDCVIVVGGQHFRAHRSVLAACSTHFRALLNAVEGDGGGASVMELDLEVVTPEAFSTLLDMIYTSTLTLGVSNVMDVLLAASHLHLNTVVKACKHHLTSRSFPTSPPRGWSSPVQQQRFSHAVDQQHLRQSPSQAAAMAGVNSRQKRSVLLQQLGLSLVTSALEGSLDVGETELDASQARGRDGGVGADGSMEQLAALSGRRHHKRKSSSPQMFLEERLNSKQSGCRLSEGNHGEGCPRVSRSNGGDELHSPDSLKTDECLCLERGSAEKQDEKYEGTLQEEVQLPSQSDSNVGGTRDDGGEDHTEGSQVDGGIVFKVKVGEDGEEEDHKMDVVVKSEQVNSYPDTPGVSNYPPFPSEDTGDHQDEPVNDEKDILSPKGNDPSSSNPHSSSNPQTDTHPLQDNTDGGDGLSDNEGLDRNQDLGLSCILNPRSQLEALGVDSLINTTISESQAESNEAVRSLQNSEATNTSSSSLMFPVTSVPFQQLLSSEGHSFSDGFILQSTQTQDVLGGFLRGFRPDVGTLGSLSLSTSLSRSSRAEMTGVGGSLGLPVYRRIAPKVNPNSEGQIDGQPQDPSSSGPAGGDTAPHPALTRASEDVLSKCKKAMMEHNVLVVEGARKYACRICCKTFLNLTDCKKHIRVHTGEKPYACLKCGKRFSQSSHLYKHSKTTCLRWQSSHLPATLL
ncbi:zinc finger and BTB domain-containing protein 5 [Oncorhynchus kisutch]|uniref:Zinc finger and BTB domain containing 5 n=1 Tax=Oncorhynchus kisutch TaxID=8019 RepID=A0A8C7D3G3_ONCKI|nr:zinc finger and BTB domain-containing protein 5 [Oncorhynchus kisutch]